MKQFMAFFILLCITTLSFPRDWVHDCHDEHTTEQSHDEHHDYDVLENDHCLACDFTIDNSSGPEIPLRYLDFDPSVKITDVYISSIHAALDLPYALRGPPRG